MNQPANQPVNSGKAPRPFTAPNSTGMVPKHFQARIIEGVCDALATQPRAPCLLRSPTGSGKTFVLTQILENISKTSPVLWLWFVPYVNLVAQTVDTLDGQSSETGLMAKHLSLAKNEPPEAGHVLVSTVQGVASAKSRKLGYTDKLDDETRSLASYFDLAKARGLEIGLVVDEAHIALDSVTEFGHFAKWLKADYLLMASATPKDARLNEFIANAGNIAFKAFSVSRGDVVAERLNKPWLETVVYDLRESMQGITDLKLTVLRRAWRRNQHIAQMLKARGLSTVPLLLVQVTPQLFGTIGQAGELDALDYLEAVSGNLPKIKRNAPANRAELIAALSAHGLRAYPRLQAVAARATPERFTTEVKPIFDVLELDIRQAAQALHLSEELKSVATRAALNLLTETEIHKELFGGVQTEESVQVVTDRTAQMERTQEALNSIGLEEQDLIDVIDELAKRLLPEIERAHAYRETNARPQPGVVRTQARDAACWVVHKQLPELQEALQAQWASKALEARAKPLPDVLLMPASKTLASSRKNIYGVLFPETDGVAIAASTLPLAAQPYFKNEEYVFTLDAQGQATGEMFTTARLDATYEFNTQEMAFAKALDRADFVAWWHRNPQGKPHSIALMRTDSRNMFNPDFVVCLHHELDDEPLTRLVETKHDVKDALRKSKHQSKTYGKVLFLTKDATRFKIVDDDGRVGEVVDFDDLSRLKAWMRETQPLQTLPAR